MMNAQETPPLIATTAFFVFRLLSETRIGFTCCLLFSISIVFICFIALSLDFYRFVLVYFQKCLRCFLLLMIISSS